ncbi:serine/threonine-protein kinase/endoribonuclease IRE1b-like [Rutidosis leptorrhynchoides]|uniref:serine/threonine-protein kinase/endoribonuclease IRE1b-like n=1 Tax=Rutidosis leptorrhynchoides TaxID=125765 RepID=UPI003A99ABD1
MMRGPLISLLRLLAVIPAAYGSLPILPPPSTTSVTPVSDQFQLPPPIPVNINSAPKEDAILVAAPDGTLYQVDITGKILWSFPSGTPIYDAYQAHDLEDDEHNSSRQNVKYYIDCGDDWQLYEHVNNFKAKKLESSAEQLIGQTPLVSVDGVLIGSKKTTVFLVDPQTGRVIYTFKSDGLPSSERNSIILKRDAQKWKEPTTLEFDPVDHDQLLYIKRFDYELTYSSSTTGNVLWSLMFADFNASFQCHGSNKFLGGKKGDAQLQDFCQSNLPVFRVRDSRNIDLVLLKNKLQMSLHGSETFALPSPEHLPNPVPLPKPPGPVLEIPHQLVPYSPLNHQQTKHVPYLPSTPWHTFDNGGNNTYLPENLASIHGWLHGFLVAIFSFIIALVFYFRRRKHSKLNEMVNNTKVQNVTSKKKKSRKLGNNVKRDVQDGFKCAEINGRKIGKLLVSDKEIGKGSNGTIVLEGVYDARYVAVKRIVKSHHDVALKEIQNLIVSDQHPNIVRWYGVEYDQHFVYIALERCVCSLHELILSQTNSTAQLQLTVEVFKAFNLWKPNGYPSPELLKVMRETVSGLAHLHELGIIHRDLKPQNVLIRKDSSISAKVSDMGISKQLPADMSCLTKSATGYGSSGWQAPEQLRNERQTRAVDLFSFGCLLFFCITGGRHPFGDTLERDINIVNDRKDLFLVDNIPEAFHLISNLLHPDPDLRPKAAEVYHHPLFWDHEMRLSFLRDASDRVELEDREAGSDLLKSLENIGAVALGGKWDEKLDNILLNDIGRYRKYKYDSVRDLLRVIRNKLNHYRELSKDIRDVLGLVPTGFESYFSSRFPKLLMEVYKVLKDYCGEEECFHKYYRQGQI